MYANDIILVDESRDGMNANLKELVEALQSKFFK